MRSSSIFPPKSAWRRRCSCSASTTRACRMKQDMPERASRTVLAFDFGLKRIGVAVGARQLEGRFHLPVARVDERFSSVEAESLLRGVKKKAIDSVAAQLLLEQYFH